MIIIIIHICEHTFKKVSNTGRFYDTSKKKSYLIFSHNYLQLGPRRAAMDLNAPLHSAY